MSPFQRVRKNFPRMSNSNSSPSVSRRTESVGLCRTLPHVTLWTGLRCPPCIERPMPYELNAFRLCFLTILGHFPGISTRPLCTPRTQHFSASTRESTCRRARWRRNQFYSLQLPILARRQGIRCPHHQMLRKRPIQMPCPRI